MNKASFQLESVNSVSDYTAIVENRLQQIREANSDDKLLFRGQPVDEPLLPKVARIQKTLLEWDIPQRHSLHDNEARMLKEFKLRSKPYLTTAPETDWDWLALAQHHGMETRLLDWTFQPNGSALFCP